MKRISIISFTKKGTELSKKIAEECREFSVSLFTKYSGAQYEESEKVSFVNEKIQAWTGYQMDERSPILFVGACAIAVRSIAPHLKDKLHDSPVLVMDEQGNYVIPILSGHMGGANELALYLAKQMGAVPVITTATDINGKFAVDAFAKKNGLCLNDKSGIARISSKILDGEKISVSIETGHLMSESVIPEYIHLISYPPVKPVDIVITSEEKEFEAVLCLRPKEYVLGMGCKKGKESAEIERFIANALKDTKIDAKQIYALASIDRKKEEPGLVVWAQKRGIPFITYSAQELAEVEGCYHDSEFVKDTVGIANVCERAAVRACGDEGKLIIEKRAWDGMTLAVARRKWRISFDEV